MLPLHPRTRRVLPAVPSGGRLHLVTPLAYGEMIRCEGNTALIVTDSGGVQKEAFRLGTPCVTVRDETEWPETRQDDRNILVAADCEQLVTVARKQLGRGRLTPPVIDHTGAARAIVQTLIAEA